MAKFRVTKPCFFADRLHEAGTVVDFGDVTPPKGSTLELPAMLQKAKAVDVQPQADVAQEDKVLKGASK